MRIAGVVAGISTRCWKVWSSLITAAVGLFALFLMAGILDNRSVLSTMIHGRSTRCFIGDSFCVWREPSGALIVDLPDQDEDRTDSFGSTVVHHACVRAAFREDDGRSLIAPIRASTHRSLLIMYDSRVTTPDEAGVRAAVVAYGNLNGYPWAGDDLIAGDITTPRLLPHGLIINAAALAMLSPGTMCALRWTQSVRRRVTESTRRHRAARGRCVACEYDLCGACGDVCPECGTLQSPAADAFTAGASR